MADNVIGKTGGMQKNILLFPDHKVSKPQFFEQDSALAVAVGDKKIIKAGTIFPANDATAEGIVENDLDVTDFDANGVVLIHGFILTSALPEAPTDEAKAALKLIYFSKV